MRRTTLLAAAALCASTLAFAPAVDDGATTTDETTTDEAEAALPDPVDIEMFLHGDAEVDLVDENAYAGDSSGVLSMDRTAPTGNYETKQITNYAQGPNARCAGNGLLPVWAGFAGRGTIVGDATLTFTALGSTGGDVVVDVFTDVNAQACNEAYPEPAASTTVTLPAGEGLVTVPIDLDGVAPSTYLMVQIRGADSANGVDNPVDDPGAPIWPSRIAPTDPMAQGRIVYDGENFQSSLSFTCQPDAVTFDADGEPSHTPDCLPF